MNLLRRILPAPLLSASLLCLWLVLARTASAGQVALGLVLALLAPKLTASLRPTRAHLRRPRAVARYVMVVVYDVIASNLQVARDVVFYRRRKPRSAFVIVPLELRDPTGLAALAVVTTIVPGTVWSELSLDQSGLLLHVWDLRDEAAFIARYKARYERPLLEIFA